MFSSLLLFFYIFNIIC